MHYEIQPHNTKAAGIWNSGGARSVSYTHLTLPTKA